jgi:hypothetical protein
MSKARRVDSAIGCVNPSFHAPVGSRSNTSSREPLVAVLTMPTNEPSGVSFGTTQRTSAPSTLGPGSSGDHVPLSVCHCRIPTVPVALP